MSGAFAIVLFATAAFLAFGSSTMDSPVLTPAKQIAKGIATQDIYQNPDRYKSLLTWSAYQQLLAAAPQAQPAKDAAPTTLEKFGAVIVLDQEVFGNSATALVQTFVKQEGKTMLIEFQFQMVPDQQTWKANTVTTLAKGEVKSK